MSKKTTAIIQQFASSRSEIQGACRFFNNAAVRPEMSLRALSEECRRMVKDKSILLVEDTSSIQRKHLSGLHADNDPHLGRTEGKDLLGFFVHPVLAVEFGVACRWIGHRQKMRTKRNLFTKKNRRAG